MFGLEMNSFNIDDGFPEAAVRALSASILKRENYEALKNAGSLAEFKLVLDDTDYGKYIVSPAEGGPLDVNWLKSKMQLKLRDEIEYLMINAASPLSEFLQRMMHSYQIENVVSIIQGAKNHQDPAITMSQINPLGELNFHGLKSVMSFGSDDLVTLFQDILIDLPVGEYFRAFIDQIISFEKLEQKKNDGGGGGEHEAVTVDKIQAMLNDNSSSDIKVFLKKIWLSQFHRWIGANCNGTTADVMDNLLKCESDWETLQIIYNSFNQKELAGAQGQGLRKKYFNNLGHLYPGYTDKLNESKEYKELAERLENTAYFEAFQRVPDPTENPDQPEVEQKTTIDDEQKKHLSRQYSLAFMGQFHYGVFYAYLKLKELEIANVTHLAEIQSIGAFGRSHGAYRKWVVPFEYGEKEQD